ncbi:unnamed protein product [Zymoseptoria tritici ST99CH_3D1]|nr:unnamed protein product [Zymoseptoria tritici ST99CH_3D1]
MTADELVDCGGWISDDSSFYGDDDLKAQLEQTSTQCRKRKYEHPFPLPPYKKLKTATAGLKTTCIEATRTEPAKREQPGLSNEQVTAETKTIRVDHFKGNPAAWQQDENIQDFLHRLPVDDPKSAEVGHWLWVGSPTLSRAHAKRRKAEDTDAFGESAHALLEAFKAERGKVEGDNPGKAAATITKKMGPFRDALESDLLFLAVETGTTSGKWLLFPQPAQLKKVWAIVAAATAEGKLGPTSKVGTTSKVGEDSTVICVYTYDFSDFDDVRRVLRQVVELGLCYADGKPIFYKCDAYTYLHIKSDNIYKLRASLYNSTDVLHNDQEALDNGPVARMQKRKKPKMMDLAHHLAG